MTAKKTIYICINKKGGQACIGPDSREVYRELLQRVKDRGDAVTIERMTCMGYCSEGPNVKIHGGPVFNAVGTDDVDRILDTTISLKIP